MRRWILALAGCLMLVCMQAQAELAFERVGYDPYTNAPYAVLDCAEANGLRIQRVGEQSYAVSDARETLIWRAESIPEDGLKAAMLPRNLDDVRRMNRVTAYLNDEPCADRGVCVNLERSGELPVYAAPSAEAYRGGDGKAAVSLKEPFTLHAERMDGWWLIEYGAPGGDRRMGYIQQPEDARVRAGGLWEIPMTLVLGEEAAMTDAPYGGCRAIKQFAAGERVTCLGYFDALWALVETDIEGRTARGFIPLRALAVPEEARLPEVEAQLAGRWRFFTGGERLNMAVEFYEDGTLQQYTYDGGEALPADWTPDMLPLVPAGERVPYAVYAAPHGRYMDGVPYVLELAHGNGMVSRYGLALLTGETAGGDGFEVFSGYGSGGYCREGQTPVPETDGWG